MQGQLCVFSVLLCKAPPAEHAQDPGSVKGPTPRRLNWRTRRTLAAGSPPALRGARGCNQVGSVENQLRSFLAKWRHLSCSLSEIVWCLKMSLDVFLLRGAELVSHCNTHSLELGEAGRFSGELIGTHTCGHPTSNSLANKH